MNALDLVLANNNILQYRTGLEDEDGILITAFSLASTRNCRKKKFKLEFYGRPAFAFFFWILELTTTSKSLHATIKSSSDGLGRRKGGSSGSSGEDSCSSCRDGNGAENDGDEKSGELHCCKFG